MMIVASKKDRREKTACNKPTNQDWHVPPTKIPLNFADFRFLVCLSSHCDIIMSHE
jgi:hypothetical protein